MFPKKISEYFFIILTCTLLNNTSIAKSHCRVEIPSLNFGYYRPFNNSDTYGTTTISIRCNKFTHVNISLSTGNSGNYSYRYMSNNNNRLFYNLFTNYFRTSIWGDGNNNSSTVSALVFRNTTKTETIYGTIAHSQSIPPGLYTDSIIAEISY